MVSVLPTAENEERSFYGRRLPNALVLAKRFEQLALSAIRSGAKARRIGWFDFHLKQRYFPRAAIE